MSDREDYFPAASLLEGGVCSGGMEYDVVFETATMLTVVFVWAREPFY